MKQMKSAFLYTLLVFSLLACNKDDSEQSTLPTMDEYLQQNANLSIYSAAIEKAGLQSFKDGIGPFTWLAPTDDAFKAAGITLDTINKMTQGDVNYLVMYHLINGSVLSIDMIAQNSFPRATQLGTAGVAQIYLGQNSVASYVNGSKIIAPDNMLSNGIIHILDRVNIPPAKRGNIQNLLTATGQHTLFIQALTKANRWAALGTASAFSVVAPTDAAMNAAGFNSAFITAATVPTVDSLVRYHYFNNIRLFSNDLGTGKETPQTALGPGRTITALNNGAQLKGKGNASPINLTRSDILGTNGLIHIADGVLRFR